MSFGIVYKQDKFNGKTLLVELLANILQILSPRPFKQKPYICAANQVLFSALKW